MISDRREYQHDYYIAHRLDLRAKQEEYHQRPEVKARAYELSQKEGRKESKRNYMQEYSKRPETRDRRREHAYHQKPEYKYFSYERNAKRRNQPFDLTYEQYLSLANAPCYLCGNKPNGNLNGIDRRNNTEGYNIRNCEPCCRMCNIMKNKHHLDEFLEHINKIVEYQKEGAND